MITKEQFIKNTNEEEAFAVFHSILYRIKENRKSIISIPEMEINILDQEIGRAITQLLKDYDNQIKEPDYDKLLFECSQRLPKSPLRLRK